MCPLQGNATPIQGTSSPAKMYHKQAFTLGKGGREEVGPMWVGPFLIAANARMYFSVKDFLKRSSKGESHKTFLFSSPSSP